MLSMQGTSRQFCVCLAKELSHVFPEHDAGDAVDEWVDDRVDEEQSPGTSEKKYAEMMQPLR